MWEQSNTMKDIHTQLDNDGWDLNDYQFNKMRKKLDIDNRMRRGFRQKRGPPDETHPEELLRNPPVTPATFHEEQIAPGLVQGLSGPVAALTPEEQARRTQRLAQIQMQSDQNLTTRKRRRRIRGLGHLPPDAPGSQPRYGSETSLDECKAFLSLDNPTYVQIRNEFQTICEANDIERKLTALADQRWQNAKDQLVRENIHLSALMNPLQDEIERKLVALDCICADVTKRMRNLRKSITMADANRALGLNPSASKELRRAFYVILDQDHFTTRLACGDAHWEELRQKWYGVAPILQAVVHEGDGYKMRCIDLLARDSAKRYGDDAIKRDPAKKQHQLVHYGPGPGAAKFRADGMTKTSRRNIKDLAARTKSTSAGPESAAGSGQGDTIVGVAMMDATATTARTSARPSGLPLPAQTPVLDYSALDPALAALCAQPTAAPSTPATSSTPSKAQMQAIAALAPISAYFRLSPNSSLIGNHPRMWLGKLASRSVGALHTAATSKAAMARVAKVLGIVKNTEGEEDSWVIDTDEELTAYVEEAEEKATFVVTLQGGYA